MTADNVSPEILQMIWNAHGLGKIDQSFKPPQGNINQCWIVNDTHVIRFDVLDWGGINRYAGEKQACELLRGSDVPVPDVLALDVSKQFVPYDYLILTKMPGKTVDDSVADLTVAARKQIAYTAGEYLATLHGFALDSFGLLYEIAAGVNKPDWAGYVADFYADYGRQARQMGVLSAETLARVQRAEAKMQPLFAAVRQGHFVHGDYHFSNLLQQDGRISGVIDFDWAMSGDPSWDFRIDDHLDSEVPGTRAFFYAGYTSRRPLPDHHWERVSFYRVGLYMDYLVTYSPQDETEVDQTLPLILRELEWLETHL